MGNISTEDAKSMESDNITRDESGAACIKCIKCNNEANSFIQCIICKKIFICKNCFFTFKPFFSDAEIRICITCKSYAHGFFYENFCK